MEGEVFAVQVHFSIILNFVKPYRSWHPISPFSPVIVRLNFMLTLEPFFISLLLLHNGSVLHFGFPRRVHVLYEVDVVRINTVDNEH